MKIKIVHGADIQIQITNHGAGRDRHDEYKLGIERFVTELAKIRPHILVLPGDMFEEWNANGDETKMFANMLHSCLPHCDRIVVIDGNHDLKQRNSLVVERSEKRMQTSAIESQVVAINNHKISYYCDTGFHQDQKFPITWAVWSHKWKFSSTVENPLPYSPYENGNKPPQNGNAVIELFHDPIRSCKGFDGKANPVFDDYKISLENFGSNIIIAGDIHSPDIIWFGSNKEKLFTYSSSLVQRNYGEGDVYYGEKISIKGNDQHGFNIIEVDTKLNRATSCTFVKLPNPVSRHTIHLGKDFNYDKIELLSIRATAFNRIKLVVDGNVQQYIANEEAIITHLKKNYECLVEVSYESSAFDIDVDESLIESVESIADTDTILKIADTYIEETVNKSKSILPEQKNDAIQYIKNSLRSELSKVETSLVKNEIKLVKAKISNFMSFSTNVEINFGDISINKISGTNGVGKTTIFSFILWMITDLISEFQSARNKNYNYSLYFNDSSELDTVGDELQFLKNGQLHILKKKLTRTRKKNGSVNGYEVSLSLESPNITSSDREEIMTYLMEEVATFEELNRSMFINQTTLTKLIKTSTADLNKRILKNIGVDFFEGMLSTYDELRSNAMEEVEKPLKTIEELIEDKNMRGEEVKTIGDKISTLKSQVLPIETVITEYDSEIEKDLELLHNVPEVSVVEDNITRTEKLITEKETELTNKSDEIKQTEELITKTDVTSINNRLNAQQIVINGVANDIKLKESSINTYKDRVISLKKDAQQTATIVKNELSVIVTNIEKEISELDLKKSSSESKKQTALNNYQSLLNGKISERQQTLNTLNKNKSDIELLLSNNENKRTSIKNGVTVLETEIKGLKRELELKNGEDNFKCPTCSQPLPEDKQKEIQKGVEYLNKQIVDKSNLVKDEQTKVVDLQKEYDTIKDEQLTPVIDSIDKCSKIIEKLGELKLEHINEKVDKASFDMYMESVNELKDISTKATELNTKLEEAKKTVIDGVKSSEKVKTAVNAFKTEQEKIPTLESELSELNTKLTTENSVLTGIRNELSVASDIEDKLTKQKEDLQEIKDGIQKLENTLENHKGDLKKSRFNVEHRKEIDDKRELRRIQKEDLDKLNNQIEASGRELLLVENSIQNTDKAINSARNYKLVDGSLKLYKRMLGTNGLPQYIFAHIIPIFNKNLNELLEDVDFRLEFNVDDLVLYFHDLKKKSVRPVMFISGMESSFAGLALIDVMRRLNNAKTTKEIFIDEISGQINSGKDVTYEAKNYQQLLIKFLNKISRHSNVYIIDHVLTFPNARILEVQPTSKGSVVKILD
ncbi:metallo-phosphoesterase [Tenacibaculum phage PTm1]|uniref:DNA repair exonuclease n=2 Tax=Shirahamavirus PTm1 TaxID=2846435 RepID=A0A5S9BZ01_9CAUD|nr:metallo-phosphoesterase [Tenacibaculum phage PTm1]BBI90467.1 DNA repair exonuclease [Tenacibaculum phage PTm1]BBI90774.1 DNA repair exonuclease [Tenacibaculum phage PTm5]